MNCNDIDYITVTNVQKMHSSLLDSAVSKGIRNDNNGGFCWTFAISTMLRQSLNLSIKYSANNFKNMNKALKKLNSDDFHRQLRNEITMIPIPKFLYGHDEDLALAHGHYLFMALERVISDIPN